MGWIVAVPLYILLFLIVIFLFVLMPRVFHKPDMTVFRTVSYTHLDVYKRQEMQCASFLRKLLTDGWLSRIIIHKYI